MNYILIYAKRLLHASKDVEPVNDENDYRRVKLWTIIAIAIYVLFFIFAAISTIARVDGELFDEYSVPVAILIILFTIYYTGFGYSTIVLNLGLFIKSTFKSTLSGYQTGEKIQTGVRITHEYGNTYRVEREDKGCLYAAIYGFINFFVFVMLSVYVCPFLSFRKIYINIRNLRNFASRKSN